MLSPLGAGGMGEVYRAYDSRLGRQVAIKVLPVELAGDSERLQRFDREARAAGSLNHPAIMAVYDVGLEGTTPYVVTELLEGQTLRARLSSERLPLRKAVEYALQMAHGLAAAHDAHVVHRDLKPENLFLTRDGRLKILDFGLAKLTEPPPRGGSGPDEDEAPTRSGVVMGTPGYMSPEQVRGEAVDHRADIFAFGAILYEMLSGRRAFRGATAPEAQVAVLTQEPPALSGLNPEAPPGLLRIVRHCLEKRREERLQSARDVVFWLESVSEGASPTPVGATPRWPRAGLALLACAATGLLVWALARRPAPPGRSPRRLVLDSLDAPPNGMSSWVPFALSPDGRLFVHERSLSLASQLWLRSLDESDSRPLAGTEGAHEPFFSPDGQWVGFWVNGSLKKVPRRGGAPVTLCPSKDLFGASWSPDGTIVYGPGEGGLQRVRDGGGTPEPLTRLDTTRGETAHLWPQLLSRPGAVLFTSRTAAGDRIEVQSLTTGARTVLVEDGGRARLLPTGHIVYARRSALYYAPIDLGGLRLTAPSAPLQDSVYTGNWGNAWFSVSEEGSLAFVPAWPGSKAHSLAWVDRAGVARSFLGPRTFLWPRLSPDAKRIAFKDDEGSGGDMWVHDLKTESLSRVSFSGTASQPLWTPAGDRLVYGVRTDRGFALTSRPVDGVGSAQELVATEAQAWPGSWSRDGRALLFSVFGPNNRGDVLSLQLQGPPAVTPFESEPSFDEWGPAVSPDGRSVAYVSDQSGRFEVYLAALADPTSKRQVSADGGTEPVWSRDGRELFFRNGGAMMSVAFAPGASLPAGKPVRLFRGPYLESVPGLPNYDVAPDGRFLMVAPAETATEPPAIHIVLDWFEELKARHP